MKNLLALIGLVVVSVAGLGWYLGWYKIGVESTDPNHPKFNVEVETDKIKQDLKKGGERVGEFLAKDGKPAPEKSVPGQTTSWQLNPEVLKSLPPLPSPPQSNGTTVIPPPPEFR